MKAETAAPWVELSAIVGADHLRPATPRDAVDTVRPEMVIEPGTAEELAGVLRCTSAAGLAVVPRGGGTKLAWGNPPRRTDLILSTARLNQVREHAWADLTATVESGCPVEQFQRTLAEHGQRLALDPLWPESATIGGILSTNDSGSLRIRYGSLRDLIIGITLALPDGTLAKSGGKVVKNVAGYDLPKLATGALGTLGIITQAIFRLHPLPAAVNTVTFTAPSPHRCGKLMASLMDSQLAFTGLQLRAQSDGLAELDIRFDGIAAGIDAQVRKAVQLAAEMKQADTPPDTWAVRQALWQGSEPALVSKFSVLPSDLGPFCDLLQSICAPHGLAWKLVAQAVGVGLLRLEGQREKNTAERALLEVVTGLRKELAQLRGTLVVLHCPPAVKSRLDVWGPSGDALPLMVRVKQQLDPTGVLNPGRFVGGI